MTSHGVVKEIEAKFHVADLESVRKRLLASGAVEAGPRVLERNWRFDRPDGSLTRADEVLRLRQDEASHLAYKRALSRIEERQEIEFAIDDLEAGHAFLTALGFKPILIYEKYRRTLEREQLRFMLDELPFGTFVEIEGPDLDSVRKAAASLGLEWSRRMSMSYLHIFQLLRDRLSLPFRDATFDQFADLPEPDLSFLSQDRPEQDEKTRKSRDDERSTG